MAGLAGLADESVQCAVTSPPYWGLRDYGISGQIGLEPTPGEYVDRMVAVFREVRRVLRSDGVLWLNLGDTYAAVGGPGWQGKNGARSGRRFTATRETVPRSMPRVSPEGIKPKDLVGVPWRVAFALQADGWWLRSDIVWAKPNPMPESITDRPTRSHEYLFLLTKRARYFYDADAIREPFQASSLSLAALADGREVEADPSRYKTGQGRAAGRPPTKDGQVMMPRRKTADTPHAGGRRQAPEPGEPGAFHPKGRNKRSVWTIPTSPFPNAHFATFPPALVEPCILAGSRPGDTVLDPFAGAGTALLVADRLGRDGIGIELNPEYARLATARVSDEAPLLHQEHRGGPSESTPEAT